MPSNPNAGAQVFGKRITGEDTAIGSTAPVQATQALTFSGNAVAGETMTAGRVTYTWTSTASDISGQTGNLILIGADAEHSIINAAAAITGTTSKGTLFSNGTVPNPDVTAVATSTTVLTVTARNVGADGNGLATTETMTNAAWGNTTTLGGVSGALLVSGAGGGSSPAGAPVTITSAAVGASGSGTIPSGAKGWTFTVLTGTATFNGVASLPAGFSESDVNTLAAAIAYSTASASSAYVRYNT